MRFLLVSMDPDLWVGLAGRQSILKRQLELAQVDYHGCEVRVGCWNIEIDKQRFCKAMMDDYIPQIGAISAVKAHVGAHEILVDLNRPGSVYPQGGMELAWALCDTFMNVSVLGSEVDVPLLQTLLPRAQVYATATHFINDQK